MPSTALRTCPLCEATCGLVLHREGDRIAKGAADPARPPQAFGRSHSRPSAAPVQVGPA